MTWEVALEWDTGATIRAWISPPDSFLDIFGSFQVTEVWNATYQLITDGIRLTPTQSQANWEMGLNVRKIVQPLNLSPEPPGNGSGAGPGTGPGNGSGAGPLIQPPPGRVWVYLTDVRLNRHIPRRIANRLCSRGWARWQGNYAIFLTHYPKELR